ncbi:MAG: hypothetical protein NUV61_02360 [Candidatus Azambacteria bacterium]|nr:hypothetical protein [Candidatus Azambacteria bacterium]
MGQFRNSGNDRFGSDRGGSGFGGRDSGRSSNFPKKSWGEQRGGDRETVMHKATCSDCGKGCEVPFRPSGDKPVYCNDCFGGKRGASTEGFVRKEFGGASARPNSEGNKGNEDVKRQLEAVNAKLERLIHAVDTVVRMQLAKQKEMVGDAPVVEHKVVIKQKPVKKEAAPKGVAKKAAAKKAGAKQGKK